MKRNRKIIRIIETFAFLILFWLLCTLNLSPSSLILGISFSLIIAIFTYDIFIDESELIGRKSFIPRVELLLVYFFVLLYEMFLGSIDVAYRTITMDINPGVVRIKTRLQSDLAATILANSITLTPGTITLDMEGDYLYIHWINVETSHMNRAGELIKSRFEMWLKRIFE